MPQYNRNDLEIAARNQHFTRDTFEKVLRLKTIFPTKKLPRNHQFLLVSSFLIRYSSVVTIASPQTGKIA